MKRALEFVEEKFCKPICMAVNNPLRLSSMDHYRYTDALYISAKLKIKVTKSMLPYTKRDMLA